MSGQTGLSHHNYSHGHWVGGKASPTYHSWGSMKARCLNPSHEAYERYGGAGITICEKWLSFSGFLEDMGERPEGTTLDRIDRTKGYQRDNCRWSDWFEQEQNKSSTIYITHNGMTKCISEWARCLGIDKGTISKRHQLGWPAWKVLSTESWRNKNRPNVVLLSHNGESHSMSEWSRILGISVQTTSRRYRNNWPIKDILRKTT